LNSEETISLLAINRITNYTPRQKFLLYEKYGSGAALFRQRTRAEALFGKTYKINGKPVDEARVKKEAEEELQYYSHRSIEIIDIHSNLYPERLSAIDDPPLVLFANGETSLLRQNGAVAIVGARKASNKSLTMAYSIARFMVHAGCVVVSGLAAGIDYYAHKGAVDGSGHTIAVLGNGIDIVYPKPNADMYESILKKGGLIISEYPLNVGPLKFHFPRRNRIISGLSLGTVVVEASGSSGALITATFALEQGREVMALPGKAGSESFEGNNRLIREGAHLVESAEDILDILGFEYERPGRGMKKLPFSPLEYNILKVIGDDRVSIEEIEGVLDDSIAQITSALTKLELNGAVVQHPGKIYSRVN
jgi:DNA processing protein